MTLTGTITTKLQARPSRIARLRVVAIPRLERRRRTTVIPRDAWVAWYDRQTF